MAYVSTVEMKKIRQEIKNTFLSKEGFKFSVKREHYSVIRIELLKCPLEIAEAEKNLNINQYYLERYSKNVKTIFEIINKIIHRNCGAEVGKHHDPQTDCFQNRYFADFSINLI